MSEFAQAELYYTSLPKLTKCNQKPKIRIGNHQGELYLGGIRNVVRLLKIGKMLEEHTKNVKTKPIEPN